MLNLGLLRKLSEIQLKPSFNKYKNKNIKNKKPVSGTTKNIQDNIAASNPLNPENNHFFVRFFINKITANNLIVFRI